MLLCNQTRFEELNTHATKDELKLNENTG